MYCCTMESVPIRPLEKEWARYKYLIMERSNETYNDIRKMFGNAGQVTALELYRKIDSALQKDIEGCTINITSGVRYPAVRLQRHQAKPLTVMPTTGCRWQEMARC